MKKVIFMLSIFINCIAYSQISSNQMENRERKSPEERVELQLKKMTVDLNLNQTQVASVKQILLDQAVKRDQIMAKRQQNRENRKTILTRDKKTAATEIKYNHQELKMQMQTVLDADQFIKWNKNQDEKREKMIEKFKERRQAK